jgi:hypothetical protein
MEEDNSNTFNQYFYDFISNKAKLLSAESSTISQLIHNPTKGLFREYSLINFLKDFLPQPYSLGKGIISDCLGKQSPETDLLIYDQSLLPAILVAENTGVFPIESVRYWFEVKTSIDNSAIEDCCKKIIRLNTLTPLQNYDPPWFNQPMPLLFGYNTTLTIDKLFKSFEEYMPNFYNQPSLVAICIIGFGYLSFCGDRGEPGKKWLFIPADDSKYEAVSFLSGILNTLAGRNSPSFGYYIMHATSEGKGKFI